MANSTVNHAYQHAFVEALADRIKYAKRGAGPSPAIERQLWAATGEILKAYISPDNWAKNGIGQPIQHLPIEVAHWLENLIEQTLAGAIPATVRAVARSGPPQYSGALLAAIETAVRYVDAARAGIVIDRAPVKTVVQAFNIKRGTFKKWRGMVDLATTDPERYWPGEDRALRASALTGDLTRAADLYRKRGRPDTGGI